MTDSTGVIQHASYTVPNFHEGYCTDDNTRALVLTVLLEELGRDSREVHGAAIAYAAFVNYAFDAGADSQSLLGRWHNFMSYSRQWLDETGSEDSLGRALWALGTCVGRSGAAGCSSGPCSCSSAVLHAVTETTSPRAWAFALLGIHEYLRRLSGDRLANQVRDTLTGRLIELHRHWASHDWPWFEEIATYTNATLPHALIVSGRWTNNGEALEIGLQSLRWLSEVQRSPRGHFRPIGSNGFFARGQHPAEFDQQPVEARAMISACIEAYRTTDDSYWLDEARRTFDWFLGRNDLGQPLYDSRTGGCCDGLHKDRVNQNQGAESTLAFLLALAEMGLLESSLAAFDRASDGQHPPQNQVPARVP